MKTLIIEDEHLAAERLQRIIETNFQEMQVMDSLDTVKDGVEYLSEHKEELDLIFCDIHLADGSSFEIFNQVDVKTPVIFTTAYDQYSLDAFNVNSIHYLLKPIKESDVINAVRKYEILQGNRNTNFRLSDLKDLLTSPKETKKHFLVKSGMKLIPKKIDEIALFYIDNKVVHVIDINDGKSYLTDFSLEEIERDQTNPDQFFRINRKQIVNMEAITAMKPHLGQRLNIEIAVRCNFDIIVSREKVTQFKKWFTG